MALFDYEKQIFLDAFHEDGLLIIAKGLGIERIFISFLKLYCDPGNLVLVLNTSTQDEEYFIDQIEKDAQTVVPKAITTEYSANDRQKIYSEGGVLFVTSRILVVDLLTKKVPINLVSGILVYNAHKIIECCQEAFILRLFRQENKTGFVKAFSDSAQSFTHGFCHVERVMKSLFVRKLYLWPRFHASVVSFLDQHKVDVVELQLHMTPLMTACQTALLQLIDACVKELKQGNIRLDMDEVTTENALTRGFNRIIHQYMEPVWHQLSAKTRQLVDDVKTLRRLMESLSQCDCVYFYNLVNAIKTGHSISGSNSGWLFMDAADNLFMHAKNRVYGISSKDIAQKKKTTDTKIENNTVSVAEECPKWFALREVLDEIEDHNISKITQTLHKITISVAEECPKWFALREVLDEIEDHNISKITQTLHKITISVVEECPKWFALREVLDEIEDHNMSPSGSGRVLITAADDRTCAQIKQYLCEGSEAMLASLMNKVQGKRTEQQAQPPRKGKVGAAKKLAQPLKNDDNTVTLTQLHGDKDVTGKGDDTPQEQASSSSSTSHPTVDSTDAYCGVLQSPFTVLHPLRGTHDPHGLVRTLYQLKPRFVILYDADVVFVRQLELYKVSMAGETLRVYFLMYSGSTEEQRYLTSLRMEKQAFEYLIREKASMVIPEERDGKMTDDPNLSRDVTPANSTVNTRKGGHDGQQQSTQNRKVIVDMREFRSDLPSLIHRRGIDVEPVTLEVGDYILTPDICVERKSVSDLIGSLNNGRLYNQAVAMCRHYKRPVLLIEFDPNKPFSLQGKYPLSSEISSQDVTSRLTLLTLHFPRLRILWCQSPYATAELFDELKVGRDEPDASVALTVTADSDADLECGKYSHAPKNMLLKMPGVNTKNVASLLNGVHNLAGLVCLSLEDLTSILGSVSHASQLHGFLHQTHHNTGTSVVDRRPIKHGGSSRGGKRRK